MRTKRAVLSIPRSPADRALKSFRVYLLLCLKWKAKSVGQRAYRESIWRFVDALINDVPASAASFGPTDARPASCKLDQTKSHKAHSPPERYSLESCPRGHNRRPHSRGRALSA